MLQLVKINHKTHTNGLTNYCQFTVFVGSINSIIADDMLTFGNSIIMMWLNNWCVSSMWNKEWKHLEFCISQSYTLRVFSYNLVAHTICALVLHRA